MVQIPPVPIPVPGDTVPPLAGIPAGSCNPNWPRVTKNPNGLSDAPPDPAAPPPRNCWNPTLPLPWNTTGCPPVIFGKLQPLGNWKGKVNCG